MSVVEIYALVAVIGGPIVIAFGLNVWLRRTVMPDGGWHYDEEFKKRLENRPMPDDLGSKWEDDVAARFEQYIRRQREKAQEHYRRAGEIAAQPAIQGHIKRAITFED